MGKFGFKEITLQNWREPDPILNAFVDLAVDAFRPATGEEWLERILEPKLLDSVPQEVQALYEVARGALVFGYFFYPLFTLGTEQLFRVADSAVANKCKVVGGPRPKVSFHKRVEWLANYGFIPQADVSLWTTLRDLRNATSHPEDNIPFVPRDAIYTLHDVARKINALFDGSS